MIVVCLVIEFLPLTAAMLRRACGRMRSQLVKGNKQRNKRGHNNNESTTQRDQHQTVTQFVLSLLFDSGLTRRSHPPPLPPPLPTPPPPPLNRLRGV